MKSSFLLLLCSVYFVLGDKKSSTGDHKKHVQHVDNTQPVSLVDTFQFKEIFNNDFGLVRGVRTVKVKAHQKTAQNITVKDLQDVEFQPFALIVDHPQIAPDDLLKATPNKTQFLNYFCYALFRWIRHNLKTNPTVQQALIQNFYQNFPFPTDLFITNQTLRAEPQEELWQLLIKYVAWIDNCNSLIILVIKEELSTETKKHSGLIESKDVKRLSSDAALRTRIDEKLRKIIFLPSVAMYGRFLKALSPAFRVENMLTSDGLALLYSYQNVSIWPLNCQQSYCLKKNLKVSTVQINRWQERNVDWQFVEESLIVQENDWQKAGEHCEQKIKSQLSIEERFHLNGVKMQFHNLAAMTIAMMSLALKSEQNKKRRYEIQYPFKLNLLDAIDLAWPSVLNEMYETSAATILKALKTSTARLIELQYPDRIKIEEKEYQQQQMIKLFKIIQSDSEKKKSMKKSTRLWRWLRKMKEKAKRAIRAKLKDLSIIK